ncbi:MAG: 30S ribosomal protein S27ae [Nanoarchaeota archaeon]|nr:30S ribosomal protein S27ae [Nanoarchaeota archaeon]
MAKDDKGKKDSKVAKKAAGARAADLYTINGPKVERKNKSCPKCGLGMFMAQHKDRIVCGKCHYCEFLQK